MESKESLKTLCGFKGDEKELDLRNKRLGAGCAVLVSNEIKDMGALSRLDISGNSIGSEQEENIKRVCTEKSITCTC